jgi:hypothetical protein
MKHDETLARLQAIRETVTRIVRDVDDAIAYLEGFQPVVEAFQKRQAAVQAQWDDLVHAGGPDNLDMEAQMHHATAVRAAEITLMNALRDYLASPEPPASDGEQSETHTEQPSASENPAPEHHPY